MHVTSALIGQGLMKVTISSANKYIKPSQTGLLAVELHLIRLISKPVSFSLITITEYRVNA